jgi:hypothetical protein
MPGEAANVKLLDKIAPPELSTRFTFVTPAPSRLNVSVILNPARTVGDDPWRQLRQRNGAKQVARGVLKYGVGCGHYGLAAVDQPALAGERRTLGGGMMQAGQ